MSDVVWVALISAGGVLISAWITQYFSANAAIRQMAHKDRQEDLQWQRGAKQRKRDAQLGHIQELWKQTLQADNMLANAILIYPRQVLLVKDMPSTAAGEVYAIALIFLPQLRQQAKDLYEAALNAQGKLLLPGADRGAVGEDWGKCFDELEQAVLAASDDIREHTE